MPVRNRGKRPNDDKLFAPKHHSGLRAATDDLCWLLSRGYAENSALQLVGNRYRLNKRQQDAVLRVGCSNAQIAERRKNIRTLADLRGQTVEIDGFNLLILLESALSGSYIFRGRDGLYRDIASVRGSYKRVVKTEAALHLVGKVLSAAEVAAVKWYFDSPVSNSGRLKSRLLTISAEAGYNWEVELVFDPDKELVKSKNIVISSDGIILESAAKWFNLGALLIKKHLPEANVLIL